MRMASRQPNPSLESEPLSKATRLGVAANVAGLFVLCDAGFVFAALRTANIPFGIPYQVALAVPAAASLALLALSAFLPDLFPSARIEKPMQWTMPVAYGALCFLAALLILQLGTKSSLAGTPKPLAAAAIWMSPAMIFGTAVVHLVMLSLALRVHRP